MLEEILRSCSNPHIAGAAVASIGGAFATRVRLHAGAAATIDGAFVAREVIRFGEEATDEQRSALADALRGSDQPILLGLQLIMALAAGQNPFAPAKAKAGRTQSNRSTDCIACVA